MSATTDPGPDRAGVGVRRVHLIRAVNVGGATLPMAELRELATELGATDVRTHIASGNLIATPPDAPDTFDRALEVAIEDRFGFFREVVSRTPAELQAALDAFPFETSEPRLCYVNALTAAPDQDGIDALAARDFGADEWRVEGRDMWIRYPSGAGRSKLTAAVIARCLGVQGTARNLLTVRALIDLAT